MPSQVTNYKCPACTGPLHFESSTGKMECEYCGKSTQDLRFAKARRIPVFRMDQLKQAEMWLAATKA